MAPLSLPQILWLVATLKRLCKPFHYYWQLFHFFYWICGSQTFGLEVKPQRIIRDVKQYPNTKSSAGERNLFRKKARWSTGKFFILYLRYASYGDLFSEANAFNCLTIDINQPKCISGPTNTFLQFKMDHHSPETCNRYCHSSLVARDRRWEKSTLRRPSCWLT